MLSSSRTRIVCCSLFILQQLRWESLPISLVTNIPWRNHRSVRRSFQIMLWRVKHTQSFLLYSVGLVVPGETRPTLSRTAPQRPLFQRRSGDKDFQKYQCSCLNDKMPVSEKSYLLWKHLSFWNQDCLELLHTHVPVISYTFLTEYVVFHRCFPPEAYWHFRTCYNNSKWLWANNFSVSLISFAKPILGWSYSKFKPLEGKQATSGFPSQGLKLLQEQSASVHFC